MKYSTKKTAGWKGAFESHWNGSFRFTAWGRTSFPLCAVEDCTTPKINAPVVGVAGLASCDPNDARILVTRRTKKAHTGFSFWSFCPAHECTICVHKFILTKFIYSSQMYSPYWPATFVFTVDAFPWSSNRFEWHTLEAFLHSSHFLLLRLELLWISSNIQVFYCKQSWVL